MWKHYFCMIIIEFILYDKKLEERIWIDEKVLTESEIEDKVVENPALIEEGFQIFEKQKKTGAGIIDLFGKDKNGKYLIVEVKRSRAKDADIGQILRYIGVLIVEMKISLEQLRGIIYCRKKPKKLDYALALMPNIEIKEFGDKFGSDPESSYVRITIPRVYVKKLGWEKGDDIELSFQTPTSLKAERVGDKFKQ